MESTRHYKKLGQQVFSKGARTILPIRDEDKYLIMKWRNEQMYHLRQASPLTREGQENYFSKVVNRLFEVDLPDQLLFSYLEDDRCIGYGGLVHINWLDRNAEISFLMDTLLEKEQFSEHWSTYLSMIEQVAFQQLGLRKLYVYAFDLRPHLYTTLESCGYFLDARLTDHCYFEGVYKDVVIYSKLDQA